MAYIVPSVQITQQLTNPGGVLAATPDLNACIIGPLYNVVRAELTVPANFTKSQVRASFTFQDSGNVESGAKYQFDIPSKVLGQVLDTTSVVYTFKNAYVKVNDFVANIIPAQFTDAENTTTITATTPHVAFSAATPDGGVALQKGDRIRYSAVVSTVTVPRVTGVRDFDLTNGTITLTNGVGTVDAANTAVVFSVYRLVPVLTVIPTSVQVSLVDANTLYKISLATSISAFPTSSTTYHVIDYVDSFNVGYRALRTDKSQTILQIDGETNRESVLGEASPNNPLSLAVQLALANTNGIVKALSISSNDSEGYAAARDVLESDSSVYALAPLTLDSSIISAFKSHVLQLSTPVEAAWRVLVCSTAIPTNKYLAGSVTTTASAYIRQTKNGSVYRTLLIDPDIDFITAGVVPTDIIDIPTFTLASGQTLPTGTIPSNIIGAWEVSAVIDSNTLELVSMDSGYTYAVTASSQSNGQFIPYKGYRLMTVSEQADYVAAVSNQFNSSRVWNLFPDSVSAMVDGVATPNLPGYYLAAAHAGMVAGFPVQQGFTNIGIAGIVDLQHSNYYFTRTNLNSMAETGTCLYVQAVQGGIPYCRHELTTDISVLEYREQLKVKNWDFLSYYYYDKLKSFIGSWNITPEMLNTVRATVIAASELLMTQKLPKIGAPLIGYQITKLEQNTVNKDRITLVIRIEIVSPANYIDVALEI